MSDAAYIDKLASLFEAHGNESNAEAMSKYMKWHFPFFGLNKPKRQELWKMYRNEHGMPRDWRTTVVQSWKYDQREMQYIGMEIAYRSKAHFQREDLALFENMIVERSWWDTVDFIASNIIGEYLYRFPDRIPVCSQRWNNSDNLWLIRTSILFQLKYKDFTDFKLLQQMINRHKYSKEFFLQKAIGWALRQYARVSPDEVLAFVTETELMPLSRREALKHLR
ncbi:MAG: DNA alkylation repair protein [Vicingaceae bacterium]